MIEVKKNVPSCTIVLKRTDKANALNLEMIRDLEQAFSDCHLEKKVRAVIIASSGDHFCSGLDVEEWRKVPSANDHCDPWREPIIEFQAVLETMLRFPKPIIAAVDGLAAAGGLALALACDLIIATPRAQFSVPSMRLGLVSGLVAPLLQFRAGASVAARMLLGGETFDAMQMHNLGLVQKVVPSERIWVQAHQNAVDLNDTAPEAVQLTKRLINEMVGESIISLLSLGASVMATSATTESAAEGIDAFLQKRPVRFPGT